MSIEVKNPGAIDHEPNEIIPYDKYRMMCDEAEPYIYRKMGISSPEDYKNVIADKRTVYIELGGLRLPMLIPLEEAGGYNVERTEELAHTESAYALALPPEFIDAAGVDLDDSLNRLGDDAAVIVQTAADETQVVKDSFSNKLDGGQWKIQDFLDPRCPEGEQVARISIYASHFEALDENGDLLPFRDLSWKELYNEDVEATGNRDTVLVEASEIHENDELFRQLWELHDEKFDWLGEYHPVSMQENEDFFKKLVTDDRTSSIIRFDKDENGEMVPVCHGIFMDGVEQIDWINDSFTKEIEQEAEMNDGHIIFFYGIASKSSGDKMFHYARDVMSLNSRLAKRRGGKVALLLESTTMSSQYIPKLVEKYTRQEPNGMTMTEAVQPVSQVDYWALVPSRSTSEITV